MTQEQALTIMKTGANVFLTGEPGSGKTHTVNAYIRYLRDHGIQPSITASTGIAATHIGGMTIHSWSGIAIKRFLTEQDLDEMGTREALVKRLVNAKVLIIDEISMLDGRILSLVDQVCRALRHSEEAFGGLQTIFVGDFFQLPPIGERGGPPVQFCFDTPTWVNANPALCYLSEQHRQDDFTFLATLGAIRRGEVEESVYECLSERHTLTEEHPAGVPRLYTHNMDVDRKNSEELALISGRAEVFHMTHQGKSNLVEQLKKGCLSPEVLELKIGASVMFTKNNFEAGYVNGTLGTVDDFDDDTGFPIVITREGETITATPAEWAVEDGGKVLAKITQIPLRLAWAITIHKSQGMSMDAAIMDLSRSFEYGQGYVALSRVRTLSGVHLLGINQRAMEVHPLVLERDAHFREASKAAEEAFGRMSEEEIMQLHHNFLNAMGGSIEKVSVHQGKATTGKTNTHAVTLALFKEGKTIEEISEERKLKPATIFDHIEHLVDEEQIASHELEHLLPIELASVLPEIHAAFMELEIPRLTPVFEKFAGEYSYDDLRLARLFLPKKD